MSAFEDEMEIRQLVATFCHLIDHGRGAEVPERCYTEDAIDDHGLGVFRGHEEMRGFFRKESLGAFLEATAHIVSNQVVDVDGDEAVSQCYVTIWTWLQSAAHKGAERGADLVEVASYDDRLLRTTDGWRITERYCRRIGPSIVGYAQESTTDLAEIINGVQTRLGDGPATPMVVDHKSGRQFVATPVSSHGA